MSEDEYSYSCMVYNKGDQEDSENMDPVSTDLFKLRYFKKLLFKRP